MLRSGDRVVISIFCAPFYATQTSDLSPYLIRKQLSAVFRAANDNAIQYLGIDPCLCRAAFGAAELVDYEGLNVVGGRALSVVNLIDILESHLDKRYNSGTDTSILILKADTAKGSVISRLISSKVTTIWLAGNDISKLNRLAMHILYESGTAVKVIPYDRIVDIKADMVISAHDASLWDLPNRFLKDCIAAAVESDLLASHREQSHEIVIGEKVQMAIPGIISHQQLVSPALAETMLLALEALRGRKLTPSGQQLTLEEVLYIRALAKKYEFSILDNGYSYKAV